MLNTKLHGVITPVVTPLNKDYSLDRSGLKHVIEHLIDGGVHGLFMLGTTGEGPHLSHALRKEVITETIAINQGRLPVLVGVTDTSIDELLDICNFAKAAGVDAVVLAATYFAPIHQSELERWMTLVISRIQLPVILYDLPSHINVKLSIDVVRALSSIEHVIGIKDSSGDMSYFNLLLASIDKPDFGFYTGPELLFGESLLAGGDGGVPGGSNLYPKLFVDIYQAARTSDVKTLAERQQAVRSLYTHLYNLNGYGSGFMCGLHAAMGAKGICQNVMMPPYFSYENENRIKDVLGELEKRFPFIV